MNPRLSEVEDVAGFVLEAEPEPELEPGEVLGLGLEQVIPEEPVDLLALGPGLVLVAAAAVVVAVVAAGLLRPNCRQTRWRRHLYSRNTGKGHQ